MWSSGDIPISCAIWELGTIFALKCRESVGKYCVQLHSVSFIDNKLKSLQ